MKKFTFFLLTAVISGSSFAEEITVAATDYPNAQILEFVKPILAQKGYTLKIEHYSSYNDPSIDLSAWQGGKAKNPNWKVSHHDVDANFFEHSVYLNQYNSLYGTNLVSVGGVFFVPFGIYSASPLTQTINMNALRNAKIAIPDNRIGETRAIQLLASNKILSFNMANPTPGLDDVESNPYNITIYRVDSAVIPDMIKKHLVDFAVMNIGSATVANISNKNLLLSESANSNYNNILVTSKENVNSRKLQTLKDALQSDSVRQFIIQKYGKTVIPAF